MKNLLYTIAILFALTNLQAQTVDIALNTTTCGDFEVVVKPTADLSNTSITNVQFTIKWPVTSPTNVSLVNTASSYTLSQQGPTVQSGGYNYATFVGVDWTSITWNSSVENSLLTFSHDQAGSGTGDFIIMADGDTQASTQNVFYVEELGSDITGVIYAGAIGVDLGLCPLYISGTFTADDKIYDASSDATINTNSLTLDGVKTGDLVTITNVVVAFADKNVGIAKTVSITSASLADTDAAKYELFLTGSPTATADITAIELTVTGASVISKIYDGNTDATITGATLVGVIASEDVVLGDETTGTFATANVGTGISVSTAPMTLSGADIANYTLTQPILSGDITGKELTVTGAVVTTKIYDANTDATITGAALVGVETGDDVVLNDASTGTFATANIGTGISVSTAPMTISGADIGNYSLTQPTLTGDITAKELTVSGALVTTKTYDGNTDATITGATLVGVETGDDVVLNDATTGTFASADVGTGISVATAPMTISGVEATNYFLTQPILTGDITLKELTVADAVVSTKEYDGNTDAVITGATLVGVVTGEDVVLGDETTGIFASADAGVGISVATAPMTIAGADIGNYSLTQPILSGDITAKDLSITADDKNKMYDGLTYSPFTVSYAGFIAGEDENDLGGLLSITGPAVTATDVGVYDIVPEGYTSTNYNIIFISGQLTIDPVPGEIKVFLQGAYNILTHEMNKDLNLNSQLPSTQPFNVDPWNYGGIETLPVTLTDEVDWVLVEIRTGTNEATMQERVAGLVNADGSVSVEFNTLLPATAYYIVVWHRNHLPVMSSSDHVLYDAASPYDFTDLLNCYGTDPVILLESTTYGMIAGDVTQNGILKYSGPGNDRGPIIAKIVEETGTNNINGFVTNGYWDEDINLNNSVLYIGTGADRAYISQNLNDLVGPELNNTYSSVVPGAVIPTKSGTSKEGAFDILISDNNAAVNIEVYNNESLINGMVDNIQFTLAWNAGDNEITEMLNSISSDFMLVPQGDIVEKDGINYQVYASITPVNLPPVFAEGESISILSIENSTGINIADRFWIANDEFTNSRNGLYYVSVWGKDNTGIIHTMPLGLAPEKNKSEVQIYPNPVSDGLLNIHILSIRNHFVDVSVHNMYGKLIQQLPYELLSGDLNRIQLDVSLLSPGAYLISISGESESFREMFIVK